MGKKVRDKCLTGMVGKEKSRDPNDAEWNRIDSPITHSKNLPGSGGSKNDLKNRSVSGTEQRGNWLEEEGQVEHNCPGKRPFTVVAF